MISKLEEYVKKFIENPGYVVQIGNGECIRRYFPHADDYCKIDTQRGLGIDIVADYTEIDRLFDYEPDTIVCLDIFAHTSKYRKTINAIRNTLIPGGIIVAIFNTTSEGSFLDSLFGGYKVLDVYSDKDMICGIAVKPYRISNDLKTN